MVSWTSIVAVTDCAHRRDVEVELVAAPARLHLRAAGNMLLELVDVVGDAAPRLVLAEVVGQVDVDGLGHCATSAAVQRFSSRGRRLCFARCIACSLAFAARCASRGSPAQAPVPAPAQPAPAPGTPPRPTSPPGRTSPAIAPGTSPRRGARGQVKAFNDYLASARSRGMVPTWQLLRTATSWDDCGGQPFEIPPTRNGRT